MNALPVADRQGAPPLIAVLAGAVVGWLLALVSPYLVLAAVAAVIMGFAALWQPAVAAWSVLLMVAVFGRSSLFAYDLPFLGGGIKITDGLVALAFGAWLVGRAVRPELRRLPSRPLTHLLLGFMALSVASLFTALSMGTPLKLSLLELRPLLSYLLVFPIVASIQRMRHVEVALVALLFAGAVAAVSTLYSFLVGDGHAATFAAGAIRVTGSTSLYALLVVIWCVCLAPFTASPRNRLVLIALACLGIAATFFTLQRGLWLAGFAGVALAVALVPGRRRSRLLGVLTAAAGCGVALIMLANMASVAGASSTLATGVERLRSVATYQSDVSSLHRLAEWDRSIELMVNYPLTGIGLGSSISFVSPMYSDVQQTTGVTHTTFYIHNSFVWFALKMGLPAALLVSAVVALTLWRAYRQYRLSEDFRTRRVLLGAGTTLAVLVLFALAGPHLNVDTGTPYAAAMIALIDVVARLPREPVEPPLHAASVVGAP